MHTAHTTADLLLGLAFDLPDADAPLARRARLLAHRLDHGAQPGADRAAALLAQLIDAAEDALPLDDVDVLDLDFDA
jgi:hypothetical protein